MKRASRKSGVARRERRANRVRRAYGAGFVTDEATSARLARQKQAGTAPELAVRAMVRELGARYRTKNRDLPGSPDLANRRRRWAIFVHGCYWHGHLGCDRATLPKRNRGFWRAKFAANRARDSRKAAELRALGFRVITTWECDLKHMKRLQARLEKFLLRLGD